MLREVTGETLQVQRFLTVGLGIVLTVALVESVVVLTKIHRKCNYFTCHDSNFVFVLLILLLMTLFVSLDP